MTHDTDETGAPPASDGAATETAVSDDAPRARADGGTVIENYDELSVSQLRDDLDENDYTAAELQTVLGYERTNQDRKTAVEALEDRIEEQNAQAAEQRADTENGPDVDTEGDGPTVPDSTAESADAEADADADADAAVDATAGDEQAAADTADADGAEAATGDAEAPTGSTADTQPGDGPRDPPSGGFDPGSDADRPDARPTRPDDQPQPRRQTRVSREQMEDAADEPNTPDNSSLPEARAGPASVHEGEDASYPMSPKQMHEDDDQINLDPTGSPRASVAPTPRTATIDLAADGTDLPNPYDADANERVRVVVDEPTHFAGVQFESRGVYDLDYRGHLRVKQALESETTNVTLHKDDPYAISREVAAERSESERRVAGGSNDAEDVGARPQYERQQDRGRPDTTTDRTQYGR